MKVFTKLNWKWDSKKVKVISHYLTFFFKTISRHLKGILKLKKKKKKKWKNKTILEIGETAAICCTDSESF